MSQSEQEFLKNHGLVLSAGQIDQHVVAAPAVLHGYAGNRPLQSLILDDEILFDREPLDLPGLLKLSDADRGTRLAHSNTRPQLWILSTPGLDVLALEGVVRTLEDCLLIDSHQDPAFALVQYREHRCVLAFCRDQVRVLPVEHASVAPFVLPETPPRTTSRPTLREVLGSVTEMSWMNAKYDLAQHGGIYHQCAAVASAARLWSSQQAHRDNLDVLAMIRDNTTPLDHARAWYTSLDAKVHEVLLDQTLIEVDRLTAMLEVFVDDEADDLRAHVSGLVQFFERRDDLQSVYTLIAKTAEAPLVLGALRSFDNQARLQATLWESISPLVPTEQLQASIQEEPNQWWAEIFR